MNWDSLLHAKMTMRRFTDQTSDIAQRFGGLAIILLAAVVRLWRLDYHSIWYDEAVSLRWASTDLSYTWRVTFQLVEEKHPPVYYSLLHLWRAMLGWFGLADNDAALRVLGALLGVLTVWGVLRLATAVGGRFTGRMAGLLVALSPVLVWYSQELRMFQPAVTGIVWFAAAIQAAWHSTTRTRRWLWWLLALIAIEAALYSYLFSAFVLPASGLTLLALLSRDRAWSCFWEGAAMLAAVGALFLPLAHNAWGVNATESTPGQPFANFTTNLAHLLRVDTIWRVDWSSAWIVAALFFLATCLLIGLLLPSRRREAGDQRLLDERVWLWLWIGIPLLIANVLLARSRSIFSEDRYLLFVVPFILWAIARGIGVLRSWVSPLGWASGAVAVVLLGAALPPLWSPARLREDWHAAAHYIMDYQRQSPGLPAAAVTHVAYMHEALEWYVRQEMDFDSLPIFHPFEGSVTPDDTEAVIAPPLNGIVDFGAKTLWLTQSHLDGVDDQRAVEGWLARSFPLITEQYPTGIKLTGYSLQTRFDSLPTLGYEATYPEAELAPGLELVACEVMTPVVTAKDTRMHPPSGWVHVRAWWRATTPLDTDYVATAQVVGPEGVWGDRLHRPTEALRFYPTSTWTSGATMRDEIDVNLNPVTPPGVYPVIVGLAGPDGAALGPTTECGQVDIR